jgi:hypothetical protein
VWAHSEKLELLVGSLHSRVVGQKNLAVQKNPHRSLAPCTAKQSVNENQPHDLSIVPFCFHQLTGAEANNGSKIVPFLI